MAGMPWAGARPPGAARSSSLRMRARAARPVPRNTIAPPSCPRAASLPLESRFLCRSHDLIRKAASFSDHALAEPTRPAGENHMRLLLGIILGAALTVGGAYVTDTASGAEAKPMVNWDVVAKNVDQVTTLARAGWKRIAGERSPS